MNKKTKDILSYTLIILGVISIAIISSKFFFRIDLTADKRYTISDDTKNILQNLDDVVFIKVYLKGELELPYVLFQKKIKETLDEFKVFGKNHVEYVFEDPFEGVKELDKRLEELGEEGLRTVPNNNEKEPPVVPGAVITYKTKSVTVNLLEAGDVRNPDTDTRINKSINFLEYNLIDAIHTLTYNKKEKIAFLQGHGELDDREVKSLTSELEKTYSTDQVWIRGSENVLDEYKLVVVAKPTRRFSQEDKIVLDQYIMKGGKIIWLLDQMRVDTDTSGYYAGLIRFFDLNLGDLLFEYGVRIRNELVLDFYSDQVKYQRNSRAPVELRRWPYWPVFLTILKHPVTPGLLQVRSQYANPIDTLKAKKQIHKTVLLQSSDKTKIHPATTMIDYSELDFPSQITDFDTSLHITGVLLEGKFKSHYRNTRIYLKDKLYHIIKESPENKMIIISDGDIIRNYFTEVNAMDYYWAPLGLNTETGKLYDNKEFLLNAIDYLMDDVGLMQLRTRNFELRPLNQEKLENRQRWQIINLVFPSLLVALFGISFIRSQKRKYTG